jgi:glycine cleavage system H protein
MEQKPGHEGEIPVLPESSLPCVWMIAGLLTYRLCDRRYECERCPLDAAIRGVELASPPADAAKAAAIPPAWGIREGLRYHPAYGWVETVDEVRLRWGIDGLMARLYDRITSVVLPAPATELTQGQIACWLLDDGELVPLRSPVSGKVTRTNQAVQRDPGLVMTSPYQEGWLVELRATAAPAAQPGLCPAAERLESAARQMAKLNRAALSRMHGDPRVGPTAADGGERLTGIRRMLGTRRYHRLIQAVLR